MPIVAFKMLSKVLIVSGFKSKVYVMIPAIFSKVHLYKRQ
jgi:hypothetical protein